MSKLLDLVDRLLGDIFQQNLYTDTRTYQKNVLDLTSNVPASVADLRGERLTPGDIYQGPPQPRSLLNVPVVGGAHPHDELKNVIPTPNASFPQFKGEMHDGGADFINGISSKLYGKGQIKESKRQKLYTSRGHQSENIPQSVTEQVNNLASNAAPPPGRGPIVENFTHQNNEQAGQIFREVADDFYKKPDGTPVSKLTALADFHESITTPATTRFTSEKLSAPDSFPSRPQDISEAGMDSPFGRHRPNEFAGVPHRPLMDSSNSESGRAEIQAKQTELQGTHHALRNSTNYDGNQFLDTGPANRGKIEDNKFDDSMFGNYQGPFRGPIPQPLNYANIVTSAYWLRNIATELGLPLEGTEARPDPSASPIPERIVKGATFLATQFLLTAMNPANPENGIGNVIYNPLSLAAAIPFVGSAGFTNITIEAAFGAGYKENSLAAEKLGASRLLRLRNGTYVEVNPGHRLTKLQSPISAPGFLGDLTAVGEGDTFDNTLSGELSLGLPVKAQVDGGPAGLVAALGGLNTNPYTAADPRTPEANLAPQKDLYGVTPFDSSLSDPAAVRLTTLFQAKSFPGGQNVDFGPSAYSFQANPFASVQRVKATKNADAPGINAAVVPVGLPGEDTDENGIPTGLSDLLSDDSIYFPFMFEDLRQKEADKKHLYFRAFLKGDINETFVPDWDAQRYYGRVDMVPIYKGTARTLNFSFDIAAFMESDLKVVYRKLEMLQSMVYPTFDLRGFMEAGPMIRLRIGDLFAGTDRRGLPGYITGMDFSYPDGIWNLEKDMVVPRLITVSLSYTVIHDGNPGIYTKAAYELDKSGNEVTNSKAERIFGAGKFTAKGDNTDVVVSRSEIRKMFTSAKK